MNKYSIAKSLYSLATFAAFVTIILVTTAMTSSAETLDTGDWYQYNGYSNFHSFSLKYPPNWQARTFGDELQGFSPANIYEETYFSVQEFEGQTYVQSIDYYKNENIGLIEVQDVISSNSGDLVTKRAIYENFNENKKFAITFIKRGSLIVALSEPNMEDAQNYPAPDAYQNTIQTIFESFRFSDDWYQYIDYGENYSFIFPTALELTNISDGVTISNPSTGTIGSVIFSILKHEGIEISDVAEEAERSAETLMEKNTILFHGIENAIEGIYFDSNYDKSFSRIFVENDGTSYELSNVNIEVNFPHLDYYDNYILEMLESFEFFDIDGELSTYKNFPDVRDDHANELSINSLTDLEIINGYPDGSFKPDGEINRAELTKMIVASKLDPDEEIYKNCFPDVKEQWFAKYICYAKEQNWVEGYPDETFKPEKNINRVEAIKIVMEALFEDLDSETELNDKSVIDIKTDDWYGQYFIFADNNNLLDKQHITVEGEKYYYFPGDNMTRKEVAETIYRGMMFLQ